MEATLFSAWIYDTLKPYAQQLDLAHPARMKAITSGKKKSDRRDARPAAAAPLSPPRRRPVGAHAGRVEARRALRGLAPQRPLVAGAGFEPATFGL